MKAAGSGRRGGGGSAHTARLPSPWHEALPQPGNDPALAGWWPWCPAWIILWVTAARNAELLPRASEVPHTGEGHISTSQRHS